MADAAKNIAGWIDGVNRGRLHGWVFHKYYPFRRLTVEISTASGSSFLVLADRYRADLQQSGLCDGYCGFSVPMRRFSVQGSVRIATQAPYFELGVVNPWQRPVAKTTKATTFRSASYLMQVDRPLGHSYITGWALGLGGTNPRRILRLLGGKSVVAQQRATLYRSEIAIGDCDGYHGFSLPLPAGLTRPLALQDVESGSVVVVKP
jgi:hypothetical protein